MQTRVGIAVLIVLSAIAVCAWAWFPALVTYAEIPPAGIQYALDDPESVERALARAAAVGRESMRESIWQRLEVVTTALVLSSCAIGYLVIRGKHAA